MSSPRDRSDDGSGWQEPAHLSGGKPDGDPGTPPADPPDPGPEEAGRPDVGDPDGPNFADRRRRPRDDEWPPPGWDLPPAERDGPSPAAPSPGEPELDRPAADGPAAGDPGRSGPGGAAPDPAGPPPGGGPVPGLFGGRRDRPPNEFERTFTYLGDLVGAQAWAVQHGWTVSDGTAPEDGPLGELVASAPVPRISKDHRPAGVLRGRADTLDLVAFDIAFPDRNRLIPQYAVTAAPLLTPVPYFRLAPARFWRHRTGALLPVQSGDPSFDSRWVLLAAEDTPGIRRLAGDATVRGMLLGTDDGDEFWSAAGHLAAIRPDGHRPQLIEHHARLLAAVVRALTGAP